MSKRDFEKLIPLFKVGEDFSLTESQYQKSVGYPLPKNFNYLKNKSALAIEAKKHGYCIEVKETTVCLKKVI